VLHVFVETNWVVDCAAPAHNKVQAALDLLSRARNDEIQLHLPAICLAEARHPISTKFQISQSSDRVRQFVTWALSTNRLTAERAGVIRTGVDLMENVVKNDLHGIEVTLRNLAKNPGLDVFPMSHAMLARSTELCFELPDLKPYDQAVLAAILVRADELLKNGERELVFCELDSDLQPWDRSRRLKPKLTELYNQANVWVYGDYLLQGPEIMPKDWHYRASKKSESH
jgi:hypothetical protein